MNSKRIYNLPCATTNTEPVTYAQWISAASTTEVSGFFRYTATATAGFTINLASNPGTTVVHWIVIDT